MCLGMVILLEFGNLYGDCSVKFGRFFSSGADGEDCSKFGMGRNSSYHLVTPYFISRFEKNIVLILRFEKYCFIFNL